MWNFIYGMQPNSGWYSIYPSGTPVERYCDFNTTLFDRRDFVLALWLNMSDPEEQCPPEFRNITQEGIRLCSRNSTPGCSSINATSIAGYTYSRVCGSTIGYAYYTVKAVVWKKNTLMDLA